MTRELELLEELAGADEDRRVTLARLDEHVAAAAELRARADRVSAVLAAAPAERERLTRQIAEAETELADRARTLAEAVGELAEAERRRDRARVLAARRFHTRASDAYAMAERQLAATRDGQRAHERAVEGAELEVSTVEQDAALLAVELARAPRVPSHAVGSPGPGLGGVQSWTTGARAALVVARSGVMSERDALIRQANELASLLLGEPQAATSAAAAVQRVERSLAS